MPPVALRGNEHDSVSGRRERATAAVAVGREAPDVTVDPWRRECAAAPAMVVSVTAAPTPRCRRERRPVTVPEGEERMAALWSPLGSASADSGPLHPPEVAGVTQVAPPPFPPCRERPAFVQTSRDCLKEKPRSPTVPKEQMCFFCLCKETTEVAPHCHTAAGNA